MRGVALILAGLAIAGCDSGTVPPPGTEPLRASTPQVAQDEVVLRGQGLIAGTEAFFFAAGENEVRAAIANVLGKADSDSANDECGAGPMTFVSYPGGLTINFQNDRLVGWNLSEASERISVEGDIQIGMVASEARATDGFAAFDDSTLGDEFSLGENLGGFIGEETVEMLYAGTQCFFR